MKEARKLDRWIWERSSPDKENSQTKKPNVAHAQHVQRTVRDYLQQWSKWGMRAWILENKVREAGVEAGANVWADVKLWFLLWVKWRSHWRELDRTVSGGSIRLDCRRTKVEAQRPVRRLWQYSRQERIVAPTRVVAVEVERKYSKYIWK